MLSEGEKKEKKRRKGGKEKKKGRKRREEREERREKEGRKGKEKKEGKGRICGNRGPKKIDESSCMKPCLWFGRLERPESFTRYSKIRDDIVDTELQD
jgi:hypothetical protein